MNGSHQNKDLYQSFIDSSTLPKQDMHMSPYEKGSSVGKPSGGLVALVLCLLALLLFVFFFPSIQSAFRRATEVFTSNVERLTDTVNTEPSSALESASVEATPVGSDLIAEDQVSVESADDSSQYLESPNAVMLTEGSAYLGMNIQDIIGAMVQNADYYYESQDDYDEYSFWMDVDYLNNGSTETWVYMYTAADTGIVEEVDYYSTLDKTQKEDMLSALQSKYEELKALYGSETDVYNYDFTDASDPYNNTTVPEILLALAADEENDYYICFEGEKNDAYIYINSDPDYEYYTVGIGYYTAA